MELFLASADFDGINGIMAANNGIFSEEEALHLSTFSSTNLPH
jgi:hypothetical protein